MADVPFLPTYCLAAIDPSEYGRALEKRPRSYVDIAVRIVNRHNDIGGVSFPKDIREILEEHDGLDQICKLVEKNMNAKGKLDGLPVDSKRLFSKQVSNIWRLELWMMPQRGTRKIFRFATGSLLQFLDGTEFVRPQVKSLYVEAHVVLRSELDA